MSQAAAPPDRCPRCGGAFTCGAAGPDPCACTGLSLSLSPALQARLREAYTGCLCLACLRELADAQPGAARAPRPLAAPP